MPIGQARHAIWPAGCSQFEITVHGIFKVLHGKNRLIDMFI
jgi:hypothetical protein